MTGSLVADLFAPAGGWIPGAALPDDRRPAFAEASALLYEEVALLDANRLDDWLSLFTSDAVYWVPLVYGAEDPGPSVNLIYDHRELLEDRVYRLQTGEVPSQDPPSRTVRLLSNMSLAQTGDADDIRIRSAFMVVEHRPRRQSLYAGHYIHRLRRTDEGLRIAGKKTQLLNSDDSLPSITFLL